MGYMNYDVIELNKDLHFTQDVDPKEINLVKGEQGTIVENYKDNCLVEFSLTGNDVYYALVEKTDIFKVWDSETQEFV